MGQIRYAGRDSRVWFSMCKYRPFVCASCKNVTRSHAWCNGYQRLCPSCFGIERTKRRDEYKRRRDISIRARNDAARLVHLRVLGIKRQERYAHA